jgi:hypothetical protein
LDQVIILRVGLRFSDAVPKLDLFFAKRRRVWVLLVGLGQSQIFIGQFCVDQSQFGFGKLSTSGVREFF